MMPVLIEGRADGRWKPKAGNENRRYPWNELEIGESFVVQRKLPHEVEPMAKAAGKRNGVVFGVLAEGRNSRVERSA